MLFIYVFLSITYYDFKYVCVSEFIIIWLLLFLFLLRFFFHDELFFSSVIIIVRVGHINGENFFYISIIINKQKQQHLE